MAYPDVILAETGLVSFWEFTETSLTNANDSKGLNDGTYTGGYTLGEPGIPSGGLSVKFNGTTALVTVPDTSTLNFVDGPLSVECWAKLNAAGADQALISRGSNSYEMRINASNQLELLKENAANIVPSTTTVTNDGSFHHFVATKNGAANVLYIDGFDVTGSITNATLANPSAIDFRIGQQHNVEFFNGWIAYPAVYSVVLNSTQVAAHYAAGQVTLTQVRPDADTATGTWATTPLWSKVDEVSAGGDVITDTAA